MVSLVGVAPSFRAMDVKEHPALGFGALYLCTMVFALLVACSDYNWLSYTITDNNIKSPTYGQSQSITLGLFRGSACNQKTDQCGEGALASDCFSATEPTAGLMWTAFALQSVVMVIVTGMFYEWSYVIEYHKRSMLSGVVCNMVASFFSIIGLSVYSSAQDKCCQSGSQECSYSHSYYAAWIICVLLLPVPLFFYMLLDDDLSDDPQVATAQQELQELTEDLRDNKAAIMELWTRKGLTVVEAGVKVDNKLAKAKEKLRAAKRAARERREQESREVQEGAVSPVSTDRSAAEGEANYPSRGSTPKAGKAATVMKAKNELNELLADVNDSDAKEDIVQMYMSKGKSREAANSAINKKVEKARKTLADAEAM